MFQGIKRRIANHSRVEIFEEEEFVDEDERQIQVNQMDQQQFGRGGATASAPGASGNGELDDIGNGKDLRLTINAKMDDQVCIGLNNTDKAKK